VATRQASYVFGPLIQNLADVGYNTSKNMVAASYDWRLPPHALEERDNYFSKLKKSIKGLRKFNNEKVLLLTHSMGFKVVSYFLWWLQGQGKQAWIDENIHGVLALAPPALGAPKLLRSLVSGDCKLGLELFLSDEEARDITRSFGSSPWLFPIGGDYHSNVKEKGSNDYKPKNIKSTLIDAGAEILWNHFEKYYLNNEYYLKKVVGKQVEGGDATEANGRHSWNLSSNPEPSSLPPALLPPPVKNFFIINGVNVDTEVNFFFKAGKGSEPVFILDLGQDGHTPINGLKTKGGIVFETRETQQKIFSGDGKIHFVKKSGDGTVPYASLSYFSRFHNRPDAPHIEIVEIEGAQHREILSNDEAFETILDYVCGREVPRSRRFL